MSSLANSRSRSDLYPPHAPIRDGRAQQLGEHSSQQTERDSIAAYAAKLVAEAPPVSESTRAKLTALLGSTARNAGVA